ncbi:HAMP domain-containing histidine kinase [Oscillochloris sp. ZM17-4]|uniref:sensor histidine kinase n=1 Tax=Oscillochloris sp. ZM17-4 TaxID=2866714 RepID=UPI001C73B8B9|nr:HAMP domain-containing sensor histidine kinase [Oscillochloris sp. ZM17-4]MBX0328153.1 HAMP domain-containing histidine kinase [Oscillochloris sp. ZM17-4]
MSYLSRRATLALLWLLVVMEVFLASYFLSTPQLIFHRIWALIFILVFAVALGFYWRGYQWPRYMVLVGVSLGAGMIHTEPYVSQVFAAAILLPPVLALVLADWRWVILSATTSYLCLLARAGWTGVYAEPFNIGLSIVLVGGMALARHLTDMALARAEEQRLLLEQERASLAARVAERTEELSAANAQLRQANQMKDAFLSSISHELRTPLNVILGSVELLREEIYGPLDERQQRALGSVDQSGRQLLGLINDILDLVKMEAGKHEFAFDMVSVSDVCSQCARLIRPEAEGKGISVTLTVAPDVGLIPSDPQRMRQILLNLLSNAVKFTPEGGKIGLLAIRCDSFVDLTVWDTGIGITDVDQGRLFQPFSQLDNRLARRYDGTGIGLALVSQLVALHRGSVSVESVAGKGSRFTVRLPVEQ